MIKASGKWNWIVESARMLTKGPSDVPRLCLDDRHNLVVHDTMNCKVRVSILARVDSEESTLEAGFKDYFSKRFNIYWRTRGEAWASRNESSVVRRPTWSVMLSIFAFSISWSP